ncbi:glutamine synthetase guanidokinase [Moniliophthora roreri MCA 2997]|uniref:Glutamine synthetase n=2 Tax=Moniliophthora roreri TaxID=221103 RepID=V2WWZ6_MONRO|nr:glutamine synthetase guanidokinase [Moniliophthora roreri MCA 2997]KAI3616505.1 glutamine synthetase guanidokinase [Moniliophthora roreri]
MEFNHGVVYNPENIENSAYTLEDADKAGAKYVRIYWVDLANIRRCRLLPIKYFKELIRSNRPGVNVANVSLGLIYLITPPSFSSIGEYLLAPELSTLRPLPFAPGHYGVLAHHEEKTPYAGPGGELTVDVAHCPRTFLKRVLADAQKTSNTKFLVGFETEFILLSSTRPVTASNVHQWSGSGGFLTGSKEAVLLEEIGDAMERSGLSLQMLHSEAAPGQYEVVSGPLTPLDAADQVIFVRELVVNLAAKHGLHATFSPRPFMGTAGSAAHIHISVHQEGTERPAKGLSVQESSFLAGVLEHLPAIPAVTLPTPASYKRVADGVWSGGTYVHYGTENREAPIRLTNATSPQSRNFEMRFIDGTANPHLALATIIGAGLTGLKSKKKLEVKDCVGPKCAWQMDDAERKAFGITKRMPLNIEQARENLEQDEVLKKIMGDVLVEKYLAVNRTLGDALTGQGETEEQELTRLVEFY